MILLVADINNVTQWLTYFKIVWQLWQSVISLYINSMEVHLNLLYFQNKFITLEVKLYIKEQTAVKFWKKIL